MKTYSHIRLNIAECRESQRPLASNDGNKIHLKNYFTMRVDIKPDQVRNFRFHNLMVELNSYNDIKVQWLHRHTCMF